MAGCTRRRPRGGAGAARATDFRQLRAGRDRFGAPLFDDGAGDPASMRFLSEPTKEVTQLLFVKFSDERARRNAAGGIEAHVERALSTEAECALGIGELVGAQAEVEQDAVGGCKAFLVGDGRQLLEIRLTQRHALAELGEAFARSGDGRLIGI